jgi:hypothetical protein
VTTTEENEDSAPPMTFRLTQAQLGEMANASDDLVNRMLKKFGTKGWLTSDVGIQSDRHQRCPVTLALRLGEVSPVCACSGPAEPGPTATFIADPECQLRADTVEKSVKYSL